MTVEETRTTLENRPDIRQLFEILQEFPEEQRGPAAIKAAEFLKSRQQGRK